MATRAFLKLAAAFAVAGCGGAPSASNPGSNVSAKNLSAGSGVVVTAGCVPTGPEQCFNAADDNCNGIIDEGCGVATGVLQFIIAWGDSPADVDLIVAEPSGAKVSKSNRTTSSGLRLEKNCPEEGCHQQNIENVFFDGLEPARGRYIVEVRLVEQHAAELPVKVHLSARVGSRTWSMDLALAPGQERQGFSFDL